MKLITSTEYVGALNRHIELLQKQLRQLEYEPVSGPDYLAISRRERKERKK